MDWRFNLWLISVIVFWGYVTWYVYNYNIPRSWSDTFYNLNKIYNSRNKGYIFTGILWATALPLIPITLDKGHALMFPTLSAIALVGAAPAFKNNKMEKNAHLFGAYLSIILGIIAYSVSYNAWYISILLILAIIGLQFKWKFNNKTMWIESLVLFTGQILILIKDVL